MSQAGQRWAWLRWACADTTAVDRELRNRISEDGEEPLESFEPLERRSPLGQYFRRLLLKLCNLGFDETAVVAAQVAEWCGARLPATERPLALSARGERMEEGTPDERVSSITTYRAAAASGDYGTALASLRRFYDFQLPSTERTVHQHALLNLAMFHYTTGGLDSALEALDEAMRHARQENDKQCLQSCVSLRYRLTTELEASAWPGSSVPRVSPHPLPPRRLAKAAAPGDELWSIKAAVDMGEPVPVAFRRVHVSLGLLHPPQDKTDKPDKPDKPDGSRHVPAGHLSLPAWHAAQAGLWAMLGSETLADMHEEMALAAPDLDDETRVDVLLARAERIAIEGRYDAALSLLLDSDTVDELSLADYRRWALATWGVLDREATLAADSDALAVINGLRAAPATISRLGPGGPLRDAFDPDEPYNTPPRRGITFAHGQVTSALRRAEKLLASHAPAHLVLPDVLSALQLSASLGLWPLYTSGTLALADTLLAMDLPAKAEAEAARVWDRLRGVDVARAALIRAKAAAALALADADVLDGSLLAVAAGYADTAIQVGDEYGARAVRRDALALRSMVGELAGLPCEKTEEAPAPLLAEKSRRVGEIVRLVGVRVAEGWK